MTLYFRKGENPWRGGQEPRVIPKSEVEPAEPNFFDKMLTKNLLEQIADLYDGPPIEAPKSNKVSKEYATKINMRFD